MITQQSKYILIPQNQKPFSFLFQKNLYILIPQNYKSFSFLLQNDLSQTKAYNPGRNNGNKEIKIKKNEFFQSLMKMKM